MKETKSTADEQNEKFNSIDEVFNKCQQYYDMGYERGVADGYEKALVRKDVIIAKIDGVRSVLNRQSSQIACDINNMLERINDYIRSLDKLKKTENQK